MNHFTVFYFASMYRTMHQFLSRDISTLDERAIYHSLVGLGSVVLADERQNAVLLLNFRSLEVMRTLLQTLAMRFPAQAAILEACQDLRQLLQM